MKKSEVNGGGMNEVFAWLKSHNSDSGSIKWSVLFLSPVSHLSSSSSTDTLCAPAEYCRNFTKFLIDKEGNVVARFGPSKTPKEIGPEIEKVL